MANYKIVTDLDLSGNKLIDVVEITREGYNEASPALDLIIRAGSNPISGGDVAGGSLILYSGDKNDGTLSNGNIELRHTNHSLVISDDSLAITLADKPFNIATGIGEIEIDSGQITIINDLWIKGNTTLGDGIGNDVTILGSDFSVVKDDLVTVTFNVENQTGNTEILGTFLQSTSVGPEEDAYRIDVASSPVFTVKGDGSTTIAGALYVNSTPIIFGAATNFTVGTDDAVVRNTTLHTTTTIGSNTNAKNLIIKGDTTFSNKTSVASTTLTTDKATVNLFDTAATTINAFGSATVIDIGSATGLTTIRNNFQVIGTTDYLTFNTAFTDGSLPEGSLFYSTDDHTLSYRPEDPNVTINLGQETVVRVRNMSGGPILNGQVVYSVQGETTGFTSHVALARANSITTSGVLGVATTDIANGNFGYVTTQGIVRGLDTSAFTAGTAIYLSYTTAGAFTTTPPTVANPDAVDVLVGSTLNSTGSQQGAISVRVVSCWTKSTTFYDMKIDTLKIRDRFTLSNVAKTVEASVYWNNTDKLLMYHTGSAIKTVIDTNSNQALSNKTYNTLSLIANTSGFTISGGTTSKSLIMKDNVTFNHQFDLNTGDLVINANALNSGINLPNGTIDFSEIDTSDPSQRAISIANGVIKVTTGIATDALGNMTIDGYLVVNGDFKSTAPTFNLLPDIISTTVNIAQLTPNINIGNLGTVANNIQIGNSEATSVINFNSPKNSTAYSNGGVVIAGGVGVAKDIYANGKLYLQNNSITNSLRLGADVDLYRSAANVLTIADSVILKDLQSSNTTFNFATATTTVMNMLLLSNASLTIGTTGANTRTVNMFADIQVGELANQKNINLFGSLNIGGPAGYGIQFDSEDNSINFIKL